MLQDKTQRTFLIQQEYNFTPPTPDPLLQQPDTLPQLSPIIFYLENKKPKQISTLPNQPQTLIIRFNKSLHYRLRHYEKHDKKTYLDLIKEIVQKLPSMKPV